MKAKWKASFVELVVEGRACWSHALLVSIVGAAVGHASAADLTYDANTGISGAQDGGGGGWNATPTNLSWWNGSANEAWPNTLADIARFGSGGAGGSVTVGTVNVGTIVFGASTSAYTLAAGTITLGVGITNTNTLATSGTISAKITGSNGLAYTGSGTTAVALTNSGNDYTGVTTLSTAGRLTINQANSLGSNAGASASTLGTNYTQIGVGTTVNFNVANTAFNEAFVLNGAGSGGSTGAIRVLQAGVTLNSLLQLGSSSTIDVNGATGLTIAGNVELGTNTLTLNNPTAGVVISGLISGATGNLTLNASGTGPYNIINNSNTYGGITTAAKVLGLGGNSVLGTSSVVLNSGGGFQSTDPTPRTISNAITSIAHGSQISFGQTTTQTGTLSFTNAGTTTIAGTAQLTVNVDTSFAGNFAGASAGITKLGSATLTLNGTNSSYTGTTAINAGILNVAKLADGTFNSSIGAGANTVGLLTFGGGTLQYTGSTAQSTNRLFTINTGGATLDASGTGVGTLRFTNPGNLSSGTGGSARSLTLKGSNTGANTLAANLLSGTSTVSLVKDGVGTWILTGNHTYTGSTEVKGGSLVLGANLAGGSLSPASVITIESGAKLVFNRSDSIVQGTDFSAAAIAGSGGIEQAGSGTTTLNVANIYTGPTRVSGGTLTLANGSITSHLTVDAAGTFSGNGTVTGNSVVNGVLTPGASAGKLTFNGNLTLGDGLPGGAGATSQFELEAGAAAPSARGVVNGYDAVDVLAGGTLTYDGTLNINLGSNTFPSGSTFDLFDFAPGNQLGNFDSVTLTGTSYGGLGGLAYSAGVWSGSFADTLFTFTNSTGVLQLSASAVPEPLTAAGVLLLAGRMLCRRNRISL